MTRTTSTEADDRAEIADLLADFFTAVSFAPGTRPDYRALPSLFWEGGRLIRNSGDVPDVRGVEEFILARQQQVDTGELTAFEEVETAHRTEVFGNVGHRLSTYEKRGSLHDIAFHTRGVICTQLIRTPSGWRISSMAWDDERPGLTVTGRYR